MNTTDTATIDDDLCVRLHRVLRPIFGTTIAIDGVEELTGGASRATYAFDAITPDGATELVLRSGVVDDPNAGMELEAAAQECAAQSGVPVPRIVVADDDPGDLGFPYLICTRVTGATIPRKILRSVGDAGSARLLTECAEALAAIHRADAGAVPGLLEQDPLEYWRGELDATGPPNATFELALRTLARDRPAPTRTTLVHGDFRLGNLMVDDTSGTARLAAVLDWELVHIGDPLEDLGWFCIRAWRFGAREELGAAGLGSIDALIDAYSAAADVDVDRHALHWWIVLATLRWGVLCRYQVSRHLSGQTRSVELAAVGRRVCETEWDVLQLLRGRGWAP